MCFIQFIHIQNEKPFEDILQSELIKILRKNKMMNTKNKINFFQANQFKSFSFTISCIRIKHMETFFITAVWHHKGLLLVIKKNLKI